MNIFSVLDDSDDEQQIPQIQQPKAVKPKKSTAVPNPTATTSTSNGKKENTNTVIPGASKLTNASSISKAAPKGENVPPSNKSKDLKSSDLKGKNISVPIVDNIESGEISKENNRGGRPRGKDKTGRGSHNREKSTTEGGTDDQPRRPKRDFERRSGTGRYIFYILNKTNNRGREVSRGGRGSFGFGNDKQDALDAEKDPLSAEPVVDAVDGEEDIEEQPESDPQEPEPVTLTLDEFMEKRNEARAKALELLGEAKTRTVSVEKEFAGLTTKDDDHDDYMTSAKASKALIKGNQRSSGKTQIVDLSFKFEATQFPEERERGDKDNRGRGGRGGGRGGRGEGGRGGRGRGRPSSGPSTVFNAMDFPSL